MCCCAGAVGAVLLLSCMLRGSHPTCAELTASFAGRCSVLLTVLRDLIDLIWTGGIDWLHVGCLGVGGTHLCMCVHDCCKLPRPPVPVRCCIVL